MYNEELVRVIRETGQFNIKWLIKNFLNFDSDFIAEFKREERLKKIKRILNDKS